MTLKPSPAGDVDQQADALLNVLYAKDEPTTAQILDYALGLATPEIARKIEASLVNNTQLRKELAELNALNPQNASATAVATAPTSTERFLQWLQAQWPNRLPLAAPLSPQSAMPALRGDADNYHVYAVGPYRLALTIVKGNVSITDHPPASTETIYTIQGQLIDQQKPDVSCEGTVQLLTHENETALSREAQLDDFGFFQITLPRAGTYRLVAALPHHTIWIQELQIQ